MITREKSRENLSGASFEFLFDLIYNLECVNENINSKLLELQDAKTCDGCKWKNEKGYPYSLTCRGCVRKPFEDRYELESE